MGGADRRIEFQHTPEEDTSSDILIQLGHISFSPYLLSIASVPRDQVSIIGALGVIAEFSYRK